VSKDIIETLRRIECSDAACGNLQIAMGVKLAIYEIKRLRLERDEARREVCLLDADILYGQILYAKERGWDCFEDKP